MGCEPEMRMPYGPGWEDPDWAPHAAPPDESSAMKLAATVDERPVVSSLAQFMEVVKRIALPRRRAAASSAMPAGQTRRWVVAGGAGFVALATLPAHARLTNGDKGEQPRLVGDEDAGDGAPRDPA